MPRSTPWNSDNDILKVNTWKTSFNYLNATAQSALTIIGMVTSISNQLVYAPRDRAGCAEFKQRTDELLSDFFVVSEDALKTIVKLT